LFPYISSIKHSKLQWQLTFKKARTAEMLLLCHQRHTPM